MGAAQVTEVTAELQNPGDLQDLPVDDLNETEVTALGPSLLKLIQMAVKTALGECRIYRVSTEHPEIDLRVLKGSHERPQTVAVWVIFKARHAPAMMRSYAKPAKRSGDKPGGPLALPPLAYAIDNETWLSLSQGSQRKPPPLKPTKFLVFITWDGDEVKNITVSRDTSRFSPRKRTYVAPPEYDFDSYEVGEIDDYCSIASEPKKRGSQPISELIPASVLEELLAE